MFREQAAERRDTISVERQPLIHVQATIDT